MKDHSEGKHVFIVGTTHSGSTVFYRLLSYHPDLAWLSQFSFRDGTVPQRRSIPFASLYDIYGRKIFHHYWSKNTNANVLVKNAARLIPSPGEGNQVWNFAFPDLKNRFYRREDVPEVRDRVLSIVKKTLEAQQKVRLLTKVPRLAQALPALATIFPHAQFIHIVRDGKAVAVSPAPPQPRGGKAALEHVRKRAVYWRETVEWIKKMEADLGEYRVLTVRYEDVCKDVRGTIRSVLEWCGLEEPAGLAHRIPESIISTNDRRFSQTVDEERREILDVLARSLKMFGYSPYS